MEEKNKDNVCDEYLTVDVAVRDMVMENVGMTKDMVLEVRQDRAFERTPEYMTPEDMVVDDHAPTDYQLQRVVTVVPILADRFPHNIMTYKKWRMNGFDIVFVTTKDQEENIASIIEEHDPPLKASLHIYNPAAPPNAGIAKNEAYTILKTYLSQPMFMFAALLDDTVDDIIDTRRAVSIMTSPGEFCKAVKRFAEESPVFGGTVAAKRHPQQCQWMGVVPVKGGFLQQAVIFSCKGTPTLRNHFRDTDEYVKKMCRLSYREVPFGEDVAFQISLYQQGVLYDMKSVQFWGIGVTRIKHKSATKRPFSEMSTATKEAIKKMMIYLRDKGALKVDPQTNELTGERVILGGPVRIYIKGGKGERPWREAYNYTFPQVPN